MTDGAKFLIVNIGHIASILLILGLAIFVYARAPKKLSSTVFFLFGLILSVFEIAFILGINLDNSLNSSKYFLFTAIFVYFPCLTLHWLYSVLKKKRLFVLIILYLAATSIIALYLVFPGTYVGESIPKLYFDNYLNPGRYFSISLIFFAVTVLYSLIELAFAFFKLKGNDRIRLKYFGISIIFAYIIISFYFFLAMNIPIDPIWTVFIGLYTIPLGYAVVRYDLVDLNVAAKRALGYAIAVGIASAFLVLIGNLNAIVVRLVPGFPSWMIPAFSGIAVVAISRLVWRQIRTVDELKYQFITVVTHKFRTPLTSIKWSAEAMEKAITENERIHASETILNATVRLEELTDRLIGLAEQGPGENKKSEDITELVRGILKYYAKKAAEKQIALVESVSAVKPIDVDRARIKFAIQIILDNAIAYTPAGGRVMFKLSDEGKNIVISVRDTGMGISEQDLPHLFSKFFRTNEAKRADTEGMGLGINLAQEIVKNHGGTIKASSEGLGKGTTFTITLPKPIRM